MIWKAGIWKKFFTVQPRGLTFLLHRHQTGTQVVLVQCFVLSTTQRPYFFVNFWLSPDDPTYFCIFLSLNAKNHALTQWPLIFWACALTECLSLLEGGPYTRIHFIFDCPPPPGPRCSLAPHLKWRYFKFRLEDYSLLRLMKRRVISHLMTAPKNRGKCESPRFIGSEEAIPASSVMIIGGAISFWIYNSYHPDKCRYFQWFSGALSFNNSQLSKMKTYIPYISQP